MVQIGLNIRNIHVPLHKNTQVESRYFKFQQFTIRDDKCAMKVGTDAVLLGAWAHVDKCQIILDIGCGSGVISLIVAQRNKEAHVTGVEIDENASKQAMENVRESPFADRITIQHVDIRTFSGQYDCIVCNPPFFNEATVSPGKSRAMARSTVTLTCEQLWAAVANLSAVGAYFNVILPFAQLGDFNMQAVAYGFSVYRTCMVHTRKENPPKRVMATYYKGVIEQVEESRLVLQEANGERTNEYKELTKEFYLPDT